MALTLTYMQFLEKYKRFFQKDGNEYCISKTWVIGGMHGGGYMGAADETREPDPEPEFEKLDELLEEICPNITFLQYKKILKETIEVKEDRDYSYYGNYTDEKTKFITAKKLYEALMIRGFWENNFLDKTEFNC